MKKIPAFISFFFAVNCSFAQLSIKPTNSNSDSYVYVKDRVLFVNQGINLHRNSEGSLTEASIYLRKEAQLIQGSTEGSMNTGNGLLSVFQEGTSNAYDYNYWSAPVGTGNSGNGFFGIEMLYSPVTQTHSYGSKSTSDLDGNSNPLSISNVWIHTYSGKLYSNWYSIQNRTEIPAAYGFIMKGVTGDDPTIVDGKPNNPGNAQRYDFRGLPNNGPIKIPVAPEAHILVGNPFPSALDLSYFLLENSGNGNLSSKCLGNIKRNNKITGIAYFWDSVENGTSHYLEDYVGGYGAFSPVDPCTSGIYERPLFKSYGNVAASPDLFGNHYERRYLPISQGFMVEGTIDSELEFKNNHRIYKKEGQLSDFKIPTAQSSEELKVIPKIRLEITINETYTRRLSLGFWPSASSGTDTAMDAKTFDLAPTDIGWLHNNEAYVIDVRPFQKEDEIPFYLKVESNQTLFKFKVVDRENFDNQEIFLYDLENQIYFPLNNSSFQISLEQGEYHKRFRLCFLNKTKAIPTPEVINSEFVVFQNNTLNQLEVWNPTEILVSSISLFDLSGKLIYTGTDFSQKSSSISTAMFAESIYVVKISMENNEVITKLITIQDSK